MDSQYATGTMLAGAPCAVLVWTLVPTAVSAPRLRQRLPSAIESLTEPPLESSTMVAPPSCRPRANSSKSLGVSAVTMPTALTQPWQFGWQEIQLNFIGNLRNSRVTPARAEPPSVAAGPNNAMQTAARPCSIQPGVAAQQVRAGATSQLPAHSEDSAFDIFRQSDRERDGKQETSDDQHVGTVAGL